MRYVGAQYWLAWLAAVLCRKQSRSLELLRSYREVINYIWKKCTADKTTTDYDAAVHCYVQLNDMKPQQFADNSIAKSCNLAHVYDKSAPNDVFIEGVDAFILISLRKNSSANPHKDSTNIAFQVYYLLLTQQGLNNAAATSSLENNLKTPYHRKLWHDQKTVNNIKTDTTRSPTGSSWHRSKSPLVLEIQTFGTPIKSLSSTPSSSSFMPSVNLFFCEVCYNFNLITPKIASHPNVRVSASLLRKTGNNSVWKNLENKINHPVTYPSHQYNHWYSRFRERRQRQSFSFLHTTHIFQTERNPSPTKKGQNKILMEWVLAINHLVSTSCSFHHRLSPLLTKELNQY